MTRLSFSALLAAATLTGHAVAEDTPSTKGKTLGTIQRVDRGLDAVLAPDAVIEMLVPNKFDWSEGPVWDKAHNRVLFSDIPKNMIWQWSAEGGLKEFLKPSGYTGTAKFEGSEPGSNALQFDGHGNLILCQHGDRRGDLGYLGGGGTYAPGCATAPTRCAEAGQRQQPGGVQRPDCQARRAARLPGRLLVRRGPVGRGRRARRRPFDPDRVRRRGAPPDRGDISSAPL